MPTLQSRHWLLVFILLLPSVCLAKHPCDSVSDPQQRQKCYAQSQQQQAEPERQRQLEQQRQRQQPQSQPPQQAPQARPPQPPQPQAQPSQPPSQPPQPPKTLTPPVVQPRLPCDSVSDPQQRQKCYAQSQPPPRLEPERQRPPEPHRPPQVQQEQRQREEQQRRQPQAEPERQRPQAQPPQRQQPQVQPPQQAPQAQPPQRPHPQVQPSQVQQPPKTLTPTEAQQRLQDLNHNRTAMPGVNRNPLPPGQVTVHPDGKHSITASGGRQIDVRPNGTVEKVVTGDGRTATFLPDGKVSTVQAGEMQIHYNRQGTRHVVTERQDRSVLVSMGPQRGYVQRPVVVHNHTYVQRTYVVNHVTYTRVYRPSFYGGVAYYHYVPVAYYSPVFYVWVFNPWLAPVLYTWGWYREPWYGYYGTYFAPYPVYPTASLWLTDFVLAENLRLAYQAQVEAQAATPPPMTGGSRYATPLAPEVKRAIAEEVRQQLAAQQAAAASTTQQPALRGPEVPAALDPRKRVFVVSSQLDTSTADGQECSLTPGDILTRLTDTPDINSYVTVSVLSSKQTDCAPGAQVTVAVQDLQEMHNRFREQIDAGLKTLADSGGTGGLPAAPDTRTQPGEVSPLTPDTNIAALLLQQQQQADQAEQEIQQWR